MHDKDYCETALFELAEELERMSGKADAKVDMAATLSHAEATLMRLTEPDLHEWLCARFEALAERHDIVAHCAHARASRRAGEDAQAPASAP
ncbi:hypothetical protein QFW80_01580 [Luteimonas sp. M1R5S18]|jgi:hypothetical protein|uniref:Uncharacterized protein n=1 Tax=Luteimonas rhizosphaericola TaxID=3042024 RepID=A0ABT6JEV1_9GAMM|nr:hypothetical protein [Luteimonas rhizosphaericola]MDH5829210.1 hypothetical protein [Luteimonas rhizosphaericola]